MNKLILKTIITLAIFCIIEPLIYDSLTQKILVESSKREYLSFFVDFSLSMFALVNFPKYIDEEIFKKEY